MRQSRFYLAALSAAATLMLGAQAHAVIIHVGTATGDPSTTVPLSVSLSTEAAMVAGTQNDFTFSGGIGAVLHVIPKPGKCSVTTTMACLLDSECPVGETCKNIKPTCAVNTAIDKAGTSFAFQPPSCQGTACTAVRSLVLSLDNVDAIPDGSTLYTCQIAVAADAGGTLPLACTNPGASDPDGQPLATTCTDGSVVISGGPTPTPTPEVTADAIIHIGTASGDKGGTVSVDVSLEVPLLGTKVAGTQNDITYSGGIGAALQIVPKAGKCSATVTTACFVDADCPVGETCKNVKPTCVVNPGIDKAGTSFAFQPPGCQAEACTAARSLVLSLDNVDPIPTGSVLYACTIAITQTAAAGHDYDLTCSNSGASDPDGQPLTTSCTNGSVHVNGEETPTPTATLSPEVTNTPTKTSTATPSPIPPTHTPNPGGGGNDDDNCSIVSPANSHAGWVLLLPAAALLWFRRRSR